MRRKPTSQGGGYNNNQQRKPRYQGSGGGSQGGHHNGGHNRPRKNYAASREKYLAQARDAMASGDRVLAENYYQHAEHCYRMMVEEGYNFRNTYAQTAQAGEGNEENAAPTEQQPDTITENTSPLPAFLTVNYEEQPKQAEPAMAQNWEERDAQ